MGKLGSERSQECGIESKLKHTYTENSFSGGIEALKRHVQKKNFSHIKNIKIFETMDIMEAIWENSAQKGPKNAGLKVTLNIHIPRTLFPAELKLLNNRFRIHIFCPDYQPDLFKFPCSCMYFVSLTTQDKAYYTQYDFGDS